MYRVTARKKMVSLTNISAYIIKDKKLFKHSDS
jgi:hypothetical protein